MAWFLLLLLLFVCFYSSCCLFFVCYYYLFYIFLLCIIYLLLFIFSIWDGVRTKDRLFHRGWGIGVEVLMRKNTEDLGELGIIIYAGQTI